MHFVVVSSIDGAERVLAGRYRVTRTLGVGGMGVVYCAIDLSSGVQVAVKVVEQRLNTNPVKLQQRFAREIAAVQRLRSPHAVHLLDAGSLPDGSHFMVMEYLEGADLHRVLRESGPLAPERAVALVLQACDAIGEAHGKGIIHRDIKPANLVVARLPDGRECLKVLDFGISKLPQATIEELALTGTGTVMGSPVYMSPEQMTSSKNVDARTDIWALGMVLYQMISGRFPYEASGLPELCAKVLSHEARRLGEVAAVSTELEEIVMRCLERDPDRRFWSIPELAASLARFAAPMAPTLFDLSGGAPAFATAALSAIESPRPSQWIRWTVGGALVGIAIGVLFLFLWPDPPAPAAKTAPAIVPPAPAPAPVQAPSPSPPAVAAPPVDPPAPPSAAPPAPAPAAAGQVTAHPPRKPRKPRRDRTPDSLAPRGEFDSPLPP
jgi:serine/threonine-protein kinase